MKPTLNSSAQPAATEQAVPLQINSALVAGMYVNTHTHTPLTNISYSCKAVRSSAADKTIVTTTFFPVYHCNTAAATCFDALLFD